MNAKRLTTGGGAAFAAAAVAGVLLSLPVALSAQELFVANSQNILVYGRTASGNVYPFERSAR